MPRRDVLGRLVGPGHALRRRVGAGWHYSREEHDDRE
jgi:hypothetical protein